MEPAAAEDVRVADAKRLATICYALYAASCLVGVTAIAAIIVNYLKRDDVAGTWVASHFEWQIKTFWYGLAGAVVSWVLMFVLIGFPLLLAVGVWVIYRIVKGWLALADGKPVDASRLV
ncbi:MAG: hypothetical protein DWB43_08770 [Lautropia sp.]|nr:MAG: hypothetical protein EDM78_10580 [Pseudomonadota bacterium]MBC6959609.1 hypothetical protein [Lautropia sp.]MCL4702479.1 DUF4870 domain-containing protein [Burkholderiaceae bacterium]MDL1906571.1 hypothetical protein [Betaproteobacteria bacterium PRO1]RIK90974.1 MAG: hypothetical protein DCC70_02555 [Burkholderiales bacterium]